MFRSITKMLYLKMIEVISEEKQEVDRTGKVMESNPQTLGRGVRIYSEVRQ